MVGDDAAGGPGPGDGVARPGTRLRGASPEGLATAEAAVALARAVGDPESLMVALQAVATSTDDPSRQLAGREPELADLAERLGDPWAASYATANLLRAYIAARSRSTRRPRR